MRPLDQVACETWLHVAMCPYPTLPCDHVYESHVVNCMIFFVVTALLGTISQRKWEMQSSRVSLVSLLLILRLFRHKMIYVVKYF